MKMRYHSGLWRWATVRSCYRSGALSQSRLPDDLVLVCSGKFVAQIPNFDPRTGEFYNMAKSSFETHHFQVHVSLDKGPRIFYITFFLWKFAALGPISNSSSIAFPRLSHCRSLTENHLEIWTDLRSASLIEYLAIKPISPWTLLDRIWFHDQCFSTNHRSCIEARIFWL